MSIWLMSSNKFPFWKFEAAACTVSQPIKWHISGSIYTQISKEPQQNSYWWQEQIQWAGRLKLQVQAYKFEQSSSKLTVNCYAPRLSLWHQWALDYIGQENDLLNWNCSQQMAQDLAWRQGKSHSCIHMPCWKYLVFFSVLCLQLQVFKTMMTHGEALHP